MMLTWTTASPGHGYERQASVIVPPAARMRSRLAMRLVFWAIELVHT